MAIAALLYLRFQAASEPLLDPSDPDNSGFWSWGGLPDSGRLSSADGTRVVGSSILRGLSDTRWPMIAFGYWAVGCLSAYLLLSLRLRRDRHLDYWALASTTALLLLYRFSRREDLRLLEKVHAS